jgi:hypothetical protein
VHYPWHPWRDRSVWVEETIEKNGRAFFRCHVEETLHHRALEIRAWMFDSACQAMSLADIPAVNNEALHEVKVLLSASSHDPIVKETQRFEGGADAKKTRRKIDTDGTVSSDNENPHVGSDAPEGPTNDDPVDVAIAASALGKRLQRQPGGQP